ncbi:hypothetical protein COL68_20905 [Bacillus wiedmannii]|nr:hypothetical protein CN607_01360 [Bacillus wiedmannii]PFX50348.1 hypothetical protein COL36_29140 [Bacillus wiedmannii]PFY95338.1 hypothetical protein COL57_21785 [Bacillus wiedmannii]PFZ54404.1 hypothetical protein COL68_20905 [Bacillus wiedmannii]PGE26810.1 hypothetical protein COM52_25490 [Bacillus wiedmannii]
MTGTPITLKATAEGSTEPEYRYLIHDEKGNLTTLQEYGNEDTVTWKPTKAGTYTIIVHAKDKKIRVLIIIMKHEQR